MNARKGLGLLAALLSIGVPVATHAQPAMRSRSALWVGAPLDEYLRLLQLSGAAPLSSRMLRPLESELRSLSLDDSSALLNPWWTRYGARQRSDTSRFGVELYDPIVRFTGNSAVPFGMNDGSLWAGRGVSGAVDVGVALRYGPLTVRLAPSITYSQNADFTLGALQPRYNNGVAAPNSIPVDMSPYADPYMSFYIDMPQRFGDRSLRAVDPGQSSVQLSTHGIRVGAGTENMWWGPGQEHSILMTNNAPGFLHAFLGTATPVNVGIGRLEVLSVVGRLDQSDYWRSAAPDSVRKRWLNALSLVFEPRGAPGLYLGLTRAFYAHVPRGGVGLSDIVEIAQPFTKSSFQTAADSAGDDVADQMLSASLRWVMPESHFEIYGELARNDHPQDRRDLVLEPDHATGYLAGFQKLFITDRGWLRLGGELVELKGGLTRFVRAQPTWYGHFIVTQGYTQGGQVIGSSIGPGGEGWMLRADHITTRRSLGAFTQWQRVNSDMYFRQHFGQFQRHFHDVFLGLGLRGTFAAGPVDFSLEALRQKEYNRYQVRGNDVVNYHLEAGAQFRIR